MIGRWVSFLDCLFIGAMLNFWGVIFLETWILWISQHLILSKSSRCLFKNKAYPPNACHWRSCQTSAILGLGVLVIPWKPPDTYPRSRKWIKWRLFVQSSLAYVGLPPHGLQHPKSMQRNWSEQIITLWSVTQLKKILKCWICIDLNTDSMLICNTSIIENCPSTFPYPFPQCISIQKNKNYPSHPWGPIPMGHRHPPILMALLCSKPLRNFLQRTTFLSCRAWRQAPPKKNLMMGSGQIVV